MATAGRILIMPKGSWASGTTYEMLDLVKRNGTSWLAKKTSVGIEPSEANSEYWQDMFDMSILGTLDDKVLPTPIYMTNDNGVTDCNSLHIGDMAYAYPDTKNAPDTSGNWTIFTYGPSDSYAKQIAINANNTVATRACADKTWTAWSKVASKADVEWVSGLKATDAITLTTTKQTKALTVEDKTQYETARLIFTINTYNRCIADINPKVNSGFTQIVTLMTNDGTPIGVAVDYTEDNTIAVRLLKENSANSVLYAVRFCK